jgi:CRISPR-associated protein Cas5t
VTTLVKQCLLQTYFEQAIEQYLTTSGGYEKGNPQDYDRDRVFAAILRPHEIDCFGSLCLGESRDLVDAVSIVSEGEMEVPCRWLVKDEEGWLTLPHWVDHVGSKGTRWQRYELQELSVNQPPETFQIRWVRNAIAQLLIQK